MTGASGFVGGRFLKDFKETHDIATVSLRSTPVEKVSFDHIDTVVHCAALVHQMQGAPTRDYFTINHELTVRLAKAAKASGVKQFVFLSTAHVFGDSGTLTDHNLRLHPDSPCHPSDPYGQSKLAAEKDLLALESEGFKVAILRPPMIYGEGSKGNFPKLVRLVEKLPILPFGFQDNRRSLIYVGNLTYFIHLVIERQVRGVMLPEDERSISIQELSQTVGRAMGKKTLFLPGTKLLVLMMSILAKRFATRLYGTLAFAPKSFPAELSYTPRFSTEAGVKNSL